MNKKILCSAVLLALFFAGHNPILADKYTLRDRRILEGSQALLTRVDEKEGVSEYASKPIIVIDDGLRYVYLSKSQITDVQLEASARPESFKTGQSVLYDSKPYYTLGNYSNSTPFNEYGRRLLPIYHTGGVEYVEQAIVELNSYYTTVTSLRADNKPIEWNMRMATHSLPREQITPILMKLINPTHLDDRIRLVRFYFDGKLYSSADAELKSILEDWKDSPESQQRIQLMFSSIRQEKYRQILDELQFWQESGQYLSVRVLIEELAQDPELPEQFVVRVQQMLRQYEETDEQCKNVLASLKEIHEQLPESEKNEKILPIIEEIGRELNHVTLQRLSTFQLYAGDTQLSAAERLAIGITGWFAGVNADNSRLATAIMLPETEKLIVDYLHSGQDYLLRQRILEQLTKLETSRPDLIAGILATMKPPFHDSLKVEAELPRGSSSLSHSPAPQGYYRFTLPSPLFAAGAVRQNRSAEIRYTVQLPPDYNPYQRYPMIVSLHGINQTPDLEIDWWAGSLTNGIRLGHATRYGYIVIAPEWNPPEVRLADYDFSVFSHAAVIGSVKDAFRRFSVDTDKVFISGHGAGGTAAWDMALAHPDMWAGAIVFNGVASRYIDAYQAAVRHVPLYLVWGELEGVGSARKWKVNAPVLNRYLQTLARPGDVTAVRYIGRGMESFYEEITSILEWMKLRQRTMPLKFEAETIRPWDSFFWWMEMPLLLADRADRMVDPVDYPTKNDPKTVKIESEIFKLTNNISVTTAPRVTNIQIFLTPDMIDFGKRTSIRVDGKNFHPPNGIIEPNIEIMLEDVRTRCDRLHPFWVMLNGE